MAHKVADPFYLSAFWRELRKRALERDRYRCTVSGCPSTHRLTVDHIIGRKDGGADDITNLRTLCASHASSIRESSTRTRGNDGALLLRGCDADGWPRVGGASIP
jgi:5-methylcytosine-specific restriction endonuclease McrA